mgnify:CR=1 FL=1
MAFNLRHKLTVPQIPVSWGELLDKICILEIKKEKVSNQTALLNVTAEFEILNNIISNEILANSEVAKLRVELKEVNLNIWNIEAEIRIKEAANDFGDRFIDLARSTYLQNDNRASIKRKINEVLKSEIIEEKIY